MTDTPASARLDGRAPAARLRPNLLVLLALVLAACMALGVPAAALARTAPAYDDADANYANVVVLVRFAGDTVGDNADGFNAPAPAAQQSYGILTAWGYLERELNSPNHDGYIKYAMVDYISYVSGGKMRLYNYLPQMGDGQTVRYVTLDKPFSAYANDDASLMRDALAKLNAQVDFDGRLADKDDDGYADCVTFFLQLPADSTSASYRSHQSTAGNAAAGQLSLGSNHPVGVDQYLAIANTSTGMGVGVFSHEFLHSLGAADYYREGGGGEGGAVTSTAQPVGMWDIMATSEGRSGTLAITRQDCGWGSIPFDTLPAAGESKTLTLTSWPNAVADPNARQAVAFKSPLNDTEYFVVEYRKKGTKYTGEWDSNIPGSGLVVYRVNPQLVEEGNFRGKDYVYLFRTGETGLHDSYSPNALVPANLSAAGTSTFGTLDPDATITSPGGALVYSDGRNSCIKITVTQDGADSATFRIEAADYASQSIWKNAEGTNGTLPIASGSTVAMTDDGSSLYVLAGAGDPSSRLSVASWDGTAWTSLPKLPAGITQPSIAVAGGKLYVAGIDTSGRLVAYVLGNDSWSKAATASPAADSSFGEGAIYSCDGKLYAAATTGGTATAYVLSGSAFSQVGEPVTGVYLTKPTVFSLGSDIGLAVADFFGDGTTAYALSGSASTVVATSKYKAGAISATTLNGTTYLLLGDNSGTTPHLLTFDASGAFLAEKNLDSLAGYGNPGNLATVGDDLLFVGTKDSHLTAMTAPASDTSAWEQLGGIVVSPAVNGVVGTLGDKVYVASSSNDVPSLKWHDPAHPVEPEPAVSYTLSYSWTGAPASAVLPEGGTYDTPEAARAAVSPVPAKGTIEKGTQGGKEGTFTFSGWNVAEPTAEGVIACTGTWTFSAYPDPVTPDPDDPPTKNSWSRVFGKNAYDTMQACVQKDDVFKDGRGGTVIVATGDGYWDALAASGLAGCEDAPIVTTTKGRLAAQAQAELQRLAPSKVVVMGGTFAVSDAAYQQIEQACPGASVSRVFGDRADDTAVEAYEAGSGWGDTCVVATIDGYWDALSIAPYAYAKKAPIFLTNMGSKQLSTATLDAIRAGGFEHVVIVGGTGAVPAAVEGQLAGHDVTRLCGRSAIDTSAEIAKWEVGQGMVTTHMAVATNNGYWDALAGAPLVGKQNSVLVLVGKTSNYKDMAAVNAVYSHDDGKVANGYVLGGEMAVSDVVWSALHGSGQ